MKIQAPGLARERVITYVGSEISGTAEGLKTVMILYIFIYIYLLIEAEVENIVNSVGEG